MRQRGDREERCVRRGGWTRESRENLRRGSRLSGAGDGARKDKGDLGSDRWGLSRSIGGRREEDRRGRCSLVECASKCVDS